MKNSRLVRLGMNCILLSDLYDKLALCSLKLYKFILFQALCQWRTEKASGRRVGSGRNRAADPALRPLAFSIVLTDREPGTGCYKFDFGNDEEILFQAGEILGGSDWSKGNVEESDLRSNLKADVLAVQGQIDDILTKRMKLLACEVSSLKRKLKGNKRAKKKKPRDLTFFDRNMMEVRLVAKKLENFSRRRHEIYKTELTYGIKLFREELEEEEIRQEETRKRSNLHNFTLIDIEDTYGSILSNSGGFVPMEGVPESSLKLVKKSKCHAETALLKYVCSVTSQRFKSLGRKGSIETLRAKIRSSIRPS